MIISDEGHREPARAVKGTKGHHQHDPRRLTELVSPTARPLSVWGRVACCSKWQYCIHGLYVPIRTHGMAVSEPRLVRRLINMLIHRNEFVPCRALMIGPARVMSGRRDSGAGRRGALGGHLGFLAIWPEKKQSTQVSHGFGFALAHGAVSLGESGPALLREQSREGPMASPRQQVSGYHYGKPPSGVESRTSDQGSIVPVHLNSSPWRAMGSASSLWLA